MIHLNVKHVSNWDGDPEMYSESFDNFYTDWVNNLDNALSFNLVKADIEPYKAWITNHEHGELATWKNDVFIIDILHGWDENYSELVVYPVVTVIAKHTHQQTKDLLRQIEIIYRHLDCSMEKIYNLANFKTNQNFKSLTF